MRFTTCLALASAAAMSASPALAASVTLYGLVDTGLSFTRSEKTPGHTTSTVSMDSGNYLGSRWGLKGDEDLGNGWHVGFVLENGFGGDTGTASDSGRLFGREAQLNVRHEAFGTIKFGRMTVLTGSTGSTCLMGGKFSAMSTGWGNVYGHNAVFAGRFARMDNTVTYSSPSVAGAKLHLQYSSGLDSVSETGRENSGAVTRYMGAGLEYGAGPLNIIAVVDSQRYASTQDDPGYTANLSVSYDFSVAKVFLAGQWFHDMRHLGKAVVDEELSDGDVFGTNVAKDGYGLNFGVSAPLAGGKLYAAAGYMDAEGARDSSLGVKRYTLSVGYDYRLSKSTLVYGGVGYMRDEYEGFGKAYARGEGNASACGASVGLVHWF